MFTKATRRTFFGLATIAALAVAATPPALAQQRTDLETIRQAGTIRVGASLAAPYYTRDANGTWSGLIPDIMDIIADYLGVKIEYVETTWGTAAAGLQTNKFDIMGAFNVTPDRALAVDFTRSIGDTTFGLITITGDPNKFETWDDVLQADMELLTVEGTGSHRTMRQLRPNLTWRGVPNRDTFFLELESGRSEYALLDEIGAAQFIEARNKGHYIQIQPRYSSPTNLAIRKDSNTEFLRWLDQTLFFMGNVGQLEAIWAKYRPKQ
jgi:polar amino acid transport system substrate-binding protein